MKNWILSVFFPPKCVLCKKVLSEAETDLCRACRENQPEHTAHKIKLSFLAQWTGLWYYKDDVRMSILRYKFYGYRSYADSYGRLLAMKLQKDGWDDTDILTWIPISRQRKRRRGYDQSELLAASVARELGMMSTSTLRKIRNTKPQSSMGSAPQRRANILGAYEVVNPAIIRGQRVLLLDDIITTGATASEAARMLLTAGAKEVKLATLAVASHEKSGKQSR